MPQNFKFPITKADGSEFKSGMELLSQLSGESTGLYLLSTNAFWHGGLHISDDTSGYVVDKRPVRAMASGEVVAYRLNDDYCTSTWGEGANAQSLQYSTSFCLVRHAYASPHKRAAGTAAPATKAEADQGPQNTLIFYSLYMHLQPYAGYAQRVLVQGTSALAYEVFPGTRRNATSNAARPDAGAESYAASYATLYGLDPVPVPAPLSLLTGTELCVLDEAEWISGNQRTTLVYAVVKAVPASTEAVPVDPYSASVSSNVVVGQRYWVTTNGSKLSSASEPSNRRRPAYWKSTRKAIGTLLRSLDALRAPAGQNAGAAIRAIPTGTKVQIEREQLLKQGTKKKPFAEVNVISLGVGEAGTLAPGDTVWISSAEADIAREPVIPDSFNSIVICEPPLPIEAGTTIGYLGLYETPGSGDEGKVSRHQAHIEIFTGDPTFDDFFANAAGLTEGKKYKMAGTDGAPAKASMSGGVTTFAPGIDPLILPVAVDTTAALAKQDSMKKKWFPLEGIGDSGVLNGWVAESRLKEVVQYDWEKLGFRKVQEANDHADGYMNPDNMPAFFRSIYKLIHASTNGEVTPDELIAANHSPAVRNALAHLMAKHPSEWQGKADAQKWQALAEKETLLKNDPERLKHELERIDALSWWDDVKGVKDFPASPNVWHFNPVMFVEVIKSGCSCENDVTEPQLIACAAGTPVAGTYADALNKAFKDFGITACINKAHFIAQTMVESSNYSTTKEILNSKRSHPAYWPYIGRGLIQLTGKDNYLAYGAAVNEDFVVDAEAMTKLEGSPHALLSAAWFYRQVGINQYGEADDFIMVTMSINGGFNGYNARLKKLNHVINILDLSKCAILNFDGIYKFEDSQVYKKKKPAFAWGIWHDPGSNKEGPTKDSVQAIKGYQRYLELDRVAGNPKNIDGTPKDQNWYGIGSKMHPKAVSIFCKERIAELNGGVL